MSVEREVAVSVFEQEQTPIVDTVVDERLLTWDEACAWLDEHTGGDWRNFRVHPPYVHCFGRKMFDVRELRQWIDR